MHIALNAQLLSDQEGYRGAGVSNYARQLLTALGELYEAGLTPHRFTAFAHTRQFTAPGIQLIQTRLPLEQPLARIAWEQAALPIYLGKLRPDLVHGLMNVLPLATRTPGVVTVHDLAFVCTPEKLPPLKRAYLTRLCSLSVGRARRVIAVSRQTADDVQRFFGLPLAKVTVVYNGVAPAFTPGTPAAAAEFRSRKGLPDRYLLYLGTLEPRKNLERLLRAFAVWRAQAPPADQSVKLVLAGGQGWYYATIFAQAAALGLEDAVIFPGFVPARELPDWYRAAAGFVYPSFFEGFGLPVLEAMACGAPVLCSGIPSLLEVAGDAALTFSPEDEDAMVNTLHLFFSQPRLQTTLRARGLAQAANFSWRRCAEETLGVYEAVGRTSFSC